MKREEMIAVVDQEIVRVAHIKELLEKCHSERFTFPAVPQPATAGAKGRVLSPEARRRIAQAQKQRWAKQKLEALVEAEPK